MSLFKNNYLCSNTGKSDKLLIYRLCIQSIQNSIVSRMEKPKETSFDCTLYAVHSTQNLCISCVGDTKKIMNSNKANDLHLEKRKKGKKKRKKGWISTSFHATGNE